VIQRAERVPMKRVEVLYVSVEKCGFPPLGVVTVPPAVHVTRELDIWRFPTLKTSLLGCEDVQVRKGSSVLEVDKELGPTH
jgi:hypothetical protein